MWLKSRDKLSHDSSHKSRIQITYWQNLDKLILNKYHANEEDKQTSDQDCCYIGHLKNEPEACVAMTGKDSRILVNSLLLRQLFKRQLFHQIFNCWLTIVNI